MPEVPANEKSTPSDETVHAVSIPLTQYALISTATFVGPLVPVLLELGIYFWVLQNVPSIPFLLWDWMGPAGMWVSFFPLVLIAAAYTYIATCVLLATGWIQHWNKQCPPEEGYFSRKFTKEGVVDHRIDYYHMRGFAIKWPMWVTSKSPFPWLVNWCLRRNDNKFGKNIMFDNAFVPLELCHAGNNVYFGPGGGASAHTVNAIFGDLFIQKIQIADNVVFGPNAIIGPGAEVLPDTVFLPNAFINSRWKDKWGTKFYTGTAVRPIPEYKGFPSPSESREKKTSK